MATDVAIEDVKALLDMATNSMDWGSGFLDHDEVAVLRRVAVVIGSDPIDATPNEWRSQYAHAYKPAKRSVWEPERFPNLEIIEVCEHCPLSEADPIHHGIDNLPIGEETP
jgi:hypothetical protein